MEGFPIIAGEGQSLADARQSPVFSDLELGSPFPELGSPFPELGSPLESSTPRSLTDLFDKVMSESKERSSETTRDLAAAIEPILENFAITNLTPDIESESLIESHSEPSKEPQYECTERGKMFLKRGKQGMLALGVVSFIALATEIYLQKSGNPWFECKLDYYKSLLVQESGSGSSGFDSGFKPSCSAMKETDFARLLGEWVVKWSNVDVLAEAYGNQLPIVILKNHICQYVELFGIGAGAIFTGATLSPVFSNRVLEKVGFVEKTE